MTETLIKVLAAPHPAAQAQALAASGFGREDVAPKPKRAPWGATREAITHAFTSGLGREGATLSDFAHAAIMMGMNVAESSLRSMALDMEKRGELRRENGRWFAVRIETGKNVGAIVGNDPTIGLPAERETAAPKPFAEGAADSTPGSAADAGSLVAG